MVDEPQVGTGGWVHSRKTCTKPTHPRVLGSYAVPGARLPRSGEVVMGLLGAANYGEADVSLGSGWPSALYQEIGSGHFVSHSWSSA